jgi:hypothetical protein
VIVIVCGFVGVMWLFQAIVEGNHGTGPLAGLYAYWWGWIPGFLFCLGIGWLLAKRG